MASNGLIFGDQSFVVGLESLELEAILSFPVERGGRQHRHLRLGRSQPGLSENIEFTIWTSKLFPTDVEEQDVNPEDKLLVGATSHNANILSGETLSLYFYSKQSWSNLGISGS